MLITEIAKVSAPKNKKDMRTLPENQEFKGLSAGQIN